MNREPGVTTLTLRDEGFETGFEFRQQIAFLIGGPGNVRERVRELMTHSRSPHRIRERVLESLGLVGIEDVAEGVSVADVRAALTAKLEVERRDGFHVSFTADGNRRWKRGNPDFEGTGHAAGARVIMDVLFPTVLEMPISELSVFLLANANLKRDQAELDALAALFAKEFANLMTLANDHNMVYRHAGNKEGLPGDMGLFLRMMEEGTASNTGLVVNFCINYSASHETVHASRKLNSELDPEVVAKMDDETYAEALRERAWVPTPADLMLRTGGDERASGAIGQRAWDSNCHYQFDENLLPDFGEQDLLRQLFRFAGGVSRLGR